MYSSMHLAARRAQAYSQLGEFAQKMDIQHQRVPAKPNDVAKASAQQSDLEKLKRRLAVISPSSGPGAYDVGRADAVLSNHIRASAYMAKGQRLKQATPSSPGPKYLPTTYEHRIKTPTMSRRDRFPPSARADDSCAHKTSGGQLSPQTYSPSYNETQRTYSIAPFPRSDRWPTSKYTLVTPSPCAYDPARGQDAVRERRGLATLSRSDRNTYSFVTGSPFM